MAGCLLAGCGEDEPANEAAPRPEEPVADVADVKEPTPEEEAPPEKPEKPEVQRLDFVSDLEQELSASLGIAVARPGESPSQAGGSLGTAPAWSTIKVPIALQAIEDAGGVEALAAEQANQIEAALTQSDNEAAAALFGEIEAEHGGLEGASDELTKVLREGGDENTVVSTVGRDSFSTYGQTDWALEDQARFMAGLAVGCAADQDATRFVLAQMGEVTSDRWGLGSVQGAELWKGGWGPDPDGAYVARQMGVLNFGGGPVVVTIAARPQDGSFESAQAAASALAQEFAKEVTPVPAGEPVC